MKEKREFLLETVTIDSNGNTEVIDSEIVSAKSIHAAKLQIRRNPKYQDYYRYYGDGRWLAMPFSDNVFLPHSHRKEGLVLKYQ